MLPQINVIGGDALLSYEGFGQKNLFYRGPANSATQGNLFIATLPPRSPATIFIYH
ncbi:MAG: hypothetical protein ACJATQ_001272 [Cellvibrionaceae bacterium]|jgi:hypothetical protein